MRTSKYLRAFSASSVLSFERSQLRALSASSALSSERSQLRAFSASSALSFQRSQLRAFSALSALSFEHSQLRAFSASSLLSFERSHIWMSAQLAISSTVQRKEVINSRHLHSLVSFFANPADPLDILPSLSHQYETFCTTTELLLKNTPHPRFYCNTATHFSNDHPEHA